jgi:hypothetical protein
METLSRRIDAPPTGTGAYGSPTPDAAMMYVRDASGAERDAMCGAAP